jgi:hypothetical protein
LGSRTLAGETQQAARNQRTAHPYPSMNRPHRDVSANVFERLLPRDGVVVNAVGQSAIQIE